MLSLLLWTVACAPKVVEPPPFPYVRVSTMTMLGPPEVETPMWEYGVPLEDFRARVNAADLDACLAALGPDDKPCWVDLDKCTWALVNHEAAFVFMDLQRCAPIPRSAWTRYDAEGRGSPLPAVAEEEAPAASP